MIIPLRKSEFRLETVSPAQLQGVWETILPGLQVVQKRSKGSWTPNHVYAAVFNNQSVLQIGYEGDLYVGFMVCTPAMDFYNGETSLVVWCCYTKFKGVVEKGLAELEKNAREAGFKTLKMQTPRKGWFRRLNAHGFRLQDYIIEKVL